ASAATPTAGIAARRRSVPPVAWAAGGVAAAMLLGGSVFFAVRGRNKPLVPPQILGTSTQTQAPASVSGGAAWDAALASALAHARDFEAKDEFRRALEMIGSLQPPDARATATVSREKKELIRRAELRVTRETAASQRGAAGARKLRELAEKMPDEAARPLLDLAAASERDWQPRDGFPALSGLFATRDIRAMKDALARIDPPSKPEERETLVGAHKAVGRFHLLIETAGAWYKNHIGQEVVVRRFDGSTTSGSIHRVADNSVLIATGSGQVSLGIRDVAISEFAARALDGCPSDELVLAAIDATLLAGRPGEAWPHAYRARRRGLELERDRERMLREQVPPEARKAAEELLVRVEKARKNPAVAGPLVREWLRLFDALPLNSQMSADAREAMRVAGGPAAAGDAQLYLRADVAAAGQEIVLRYDNADALLADFAPRARARALAGSGPGLEAESGYAYLILRGLHWTEIAIDAEIRTDSVLAFLPGWRSRYETLNLALEPGKNGKIQVKPPIPSKAFEAARDSEGWIRVSMALADGHFNAKVAGESFACEVPGSWTGELALWFENAFEFRRIEIRGRAKFLEPDMDEEFAPLTRAMKGRRKDIPSNWRDWMEGEPEKEKAEVKAGAKWKWLRPPAWEAGDDYHMKFKAKAGDGAEIAISVRVGEGQREIVLGDESANGFVADGRFLLTGNGLPLPRYEWVSVDIQVHGNLAAIEVGGKTWFGHLEPLEHGGVEIGVKGGTVSFMDLKIEQLGD
ncbi:MAG: hypothetical protein FD180_4946, partial [Planctomycetota bacterium]